jgi:hypothetical protein
LIARILICSVLLQVVPLAIVYEELSGKVPGVTVVARELPCGGAGAIILSTNDRRKGYLDVASFTSASPV